MDDPAAPADPRPIEARASWLAATLSAGVLGALWAVGPACFNSDDRGDFRIAVTDDGYTTDDGGDDDTTTGEIPPDLPPPDTTCREYIDCLIACAADPELWNTDEPDLTCFVECDEGLTVEEALLFLEFSKCVGDRCVEQGDCVEPEDFLGSDGTNSGLPIDPTSVCASCMFGLLLDPESPGCEAPSAQCQ